MAATNLTKLDEPPDSRPPPKEKVEEIVEIDRSPDSRFIKYKKEVSIFTDFDIKWPVKIKLSCIIYFPKGNLNLTLRLAVEVSRQFLKVSIATRAPLLLGLSSNRTKSQKKTENVSRYFLSFLYLILLYIIDYWFIVYNYRLLKIIFYSARGVNSQKIETCKYRSIFWHLGNKYFFERWKNNSSCYGAHDVRYPENVPQTLQGHSIETVKKLVATNYSWIKIFALKKSGYSSQRSKMW